MEIPQGYIEAAFNPSSTSHLKFVSMSFSVLGTGLAALDEWDPSNAQLKLVTVVSSVHGPDLWTTAKFAH